MSQGDVSRRETVPCLPPVDAAPILSHCPSHNGKIYGTVGADHQLPARVDDRGVVDIYATVQDALDLVDDQYVWPRSGWRPADIHHFVWERAKYLPQQWQGDRIPSEYREIPYHKGYLPRQLHNFIHAVIAPPPIPDYEVMRSRVESYAVAKRLFASARLAVLADRRPDRIGGIRRVAFGEAYIEDEVLRTVYDSMVNRFIEHAVVASPDNEFITMSGIDLNSPQPEEFAKKLGRVAAHNGINLMPFVYAKRTAA